MRLLRSDRRSERGSAALEAAIVAPVLLLLIGLLAFAGRITLAQQAVDAASMDGARAASIARSAGAASRDARAAGTSTLANKNLRCSSTSVSTDTAGFSTPVGTAATTTVTVHCLVYLADLTVPGIPGARTVTASTSSPLDTYRERTSG